MKITFCEKGLKFRSDGGAVFLSVQSRPRDNKEQKFDRLLPLDDHILFRKLPSTIDLEELLLAADPSDDETKDYADDFDVVNKKKNFEQVVEFSEFRSTRNPKGRLLRLAAAKFQTFYVAQNH
ncbi:hypothetical protein EXN66_Car003673 [Channa argus]|uniref:Uncharacterized protein n=1 Tax=Channa argus TaxID=215402 RepID=A0A6G1PCH6_CHAAH|nr:hypothetical protein EXN66_Car003673 [Channa argus]